MTAAHIRILLTEDVASDAELELRELKRAGMRVEHRIADTEPEFRRALLDFKPDVILSDFSMPQFDGMSALAIARETCPDTPFIFVSGTLGEEYAIRAIKSGATDYVLKTNLARLPPAVERALGEARQRAAQRQAETELRESELRFQATFDQAAVGICHVATDGMILIANRRIGEILGYQKAELIGRSVYDLSHPDDRSVTAGEVGKLHSGEIATFSKEKRYLRSDGATVWVNLTVAAARDTRGEQYDISVMEDITARKRGEQLLALEHAIVTQCAQAESRVAGLKAVMRAICETEGWDVGRYFRVDEKLRQLRFVESWAIEDPAVQRFVEGSQGTLYEFGEGLIGGAWKEEKPLWSTDLSSDARVQRSGLAKSAGIAAAFVMPVASRHGTMGVMAFSSREARDPDERLLRSMQVIGSQIGQFLERQEQQERLNYLAYYDELTGLANRALFHERLTEAIAAAQRTGGALALCLLDLERFKAINDTFGQRTGDYVLQTVALRLQEFGGEANAVARLGSNLFALTLHGANAESLTRQIEDRSAKLFDLPLGIEGQEIRVAAKAGIAVFPQHGTEAGALSRNAEASLKRAKETGDRYLFYAPHINARVAEQVELESRLRRAVDNGELFLHYQPKLDLASRTIIGLEALLRWSTADGLVSPARFVPVLEQTGLILEAGRQALAAAKNAHRELKRRGIAAPRIAVNVSALQLRRRTFVEDVTAALGDPGSDGGGVDLEITESLLMTDVDESIRKLRALRKLGLHIALDDFGTGYSSLAYLSKLPLDALKIDRGFVRGMTDNADDTSIVSTIISLAQSLRLKVVAEGVESEQQAQLLRLLRCDQVQGYLFSPPVALERIAALLQGAPA